MDKSHWFSVIPTQPFASSEQRSMSSAGRLAGRGEVREGKRGKKDKQGKFRRSLLNSCFARLRAKTSGETRRSLPPPADTLRARAAREGKRKGAGAGQRAPPAGCHPAPCHPSRVTPPVSPSVSPSRPRSWRDAGSGVAVKQSLRERAASTRGSGRAPNPCDKRITDPWVPNPAADGALF